MVWDVIHLSPADAEARSGKLKLGSNIVGALNVDRSATKLRTLFKKTTTTPLTKSSVREDVIHEEPCP